MATRSVTGSATKGKRTKKGGAKGTADRGELLRQFDRLLRSAAPSEQCSDEGLLALVLQHLGSAPSDADRRSRLLMPNLRKIEAGGAALINLGCIGPAWKALRAEMARRGFSASELKELDGRIGDHLQSEHHRAGDGLLAVASLVATLGIALKERRTAVQKVAAELQEVKSDIGELTSRINAIREREGDGFVADLLAELGLSGALVLTASGIVQSAKHGAGDALGAVANMARRAGARLDEVGRSMTEDRIIGGKEGARGG